MIWHTLTVFLTALEKQMKPADFLLGRKTFEIFASYWQEHGNSWPGINDVTEYVMSRTMKKSDPIAIGITKDTLSLLIIKAWTWTNII